MFQHSSHLRAASRDLQLQQTFNPQGRKGLTALQGYSTACQVFITTEVPCAHHHLPSDYFNPSTASFPASSHPSCRVPGLRNSPERRQTSRVKEAVLRELWESPHHILPLTIELSPPSKARPLFPGFPVPKTLTLEAGALFKQALWAPGPGIGVPQLC